MNLEKQNSKIIKSDYIGAEINLEQMGFFSPIMTKRPISTKKVTRIIKDNGNSKKIEISIMPLAALGRPIADDLDIYRAFCDLLKDIYQKDGIIKNPVFFKDEELIKRMGKTRGGNKNKGIREWLQRMRGTLIVGQFYSKKDNRYVETKSVGIGVFNEVLTYGDKLESGKEANGNYVWLSKWFLNNINMGYITLIDYKIHKLLRKPIAKCLYSILWIGFYAIKKNGASFYCKDYKTLCEFLDIVIHKSKSLVIRQLKPSLEELKLQKVISKWAIEKNKNESGYNVYFWPGEAFEIYYQAIGKSVQLTLDGILEDNPKEICCNSNKEIKELLLEDNTIKIVKHFHKSIHGSEKDYTKKELGQANELLIKYGNDQTWHILRFAIYKMHHTNFKPNHFGAVLKYVDDGVKDYRLTKAKEEREIKEKEQQHNDRVVEYKKWLSQTPEERIKPGLSLYLARLKTFENREPEPEELKAKIQELLTLEPTPKRKQEILFGKVIFD